MIENMEKRRSNKPSKLEGMLKTFGGKEKSSKRGNTKGAASELCSRLREFLDVKYGSDLDYRNYQVLHTNWRQSQKSAEGWAKYCNLNEILASRYCIIFFRE